MKLFLTMSGSFAVALALLVHAAIATELVPAGKASPPNVATEAQTNTICPVSGKPANPSISYAYEGRTWSFADDASLSKFKADRENSLYHKLGGKPAIDAAVELFYKKILADKRVNHFFEDINMTAQRRRQKDFLCAAFGGPVPWTGKDMRRAHEDLVIEEADFNAIAENLVATLKDLKISQEYIDQVVAIVVSVKDDVMQRPKNAAQ